MMQRRRISWRGFCFFEEDEKVRGQLICVVVVVVVDVDVDCRGVYIFVIWIRTFQNT